MIMMPLVSSAVTTKFSIEDLIICYSKYARLETESSESTDEESKVDTKVSSVDGRLPTWGNLQEVRRSEWKPPEGKKERIEYEKLRAITDAVVVGFQKSSKYNSFKKDVEKSCAWHEEFKELVPIGAGGEVDEREYEANEVKLDDCVRMFEAAISEASLREIVDTEEVAQMDNSFIRTIKRISNVTRGTVLNVMTEVGKMGTVAMLGQLVIELLYLGIDTWRPFLGFEWGFGRKAVMADDNGMDNITGPRRVYQDDHSKVFRVVGSAARMAVEQEYRVNEDMTAALKNNIVLCFLTNKMKQVILIVLGVVLLRSGAWSAICIMILRLGNQFV